MKLNLADDSVLRFYGKEDVPLCFQWHGKRQYRAE